MRPSPNCFSSCLRPAEVFMSLPMAAWPEAMASMHAAEPPTVGMAYAEATISLYSCMSTLAWTGAEEATAACTSEGYLTRNQPASIPG